MTFEAPFTLINKKAKDLVFMKLYENQVFRFFTEGVCKVKIF